MLMIKRISILALVAVTLWGCAAPQNNTQKGAVYGTGIGAAVGAGLGQAIGGNTKSTLIGAGIGAALGGVTGGAIGRYMDNQEYGDQPGGQCSGSVPTDEYSDCWPYRQHRL